jgi:two-component system response regulator VicR
MKILIADDDAAIRLLVRKALEDVGYEVVCTESGRDALALFEIDRFDMVILDVMMPLLDGFEVCRRIRKADDDVPVLFLSAKGDIVDKRIGFSTGADDYLVKPFNSEELLMRVEALMRRRRKDVSQKQAAPQVLAVGSFVLDAVRHQVLKDGHPIALTPKEFQLLFTLASHQSAVMSREELIEAVWGSEYLGDSINIAVYIRRIREKIEDDPTKAAHLVTVWGVGYAFKA